MDKSVVVDEKFSSSWKSSFYYSIALATLFFIFYWNADDVIWSGLLQLSAFISFSIGIFCLLKIMEGRKQFRIAVNDENLQIDYIKNDKVIHKEVLEQKEIQSIYKIPLAFKIPLIELKLDFSNDWVFNIRLKDVEKDGSLFKFGGKALSLDSQNSKQLESFLKEHNLYSQT